MAVVSFRVDEELKRRMDRLRHVSWSEVLRRCLAEAVREEALARKEDMEGIRRASQEIDSLRAGFAMKVVETCFAHGLTLYDACYVALANLMGIPYYTADEEVVRGSQGRTSNA